MQSPAALNCDSNSVSRAEREGDNDTISKTQCQKPEVLSHQKASAGQHATACIVLTHVHNITMYPLQTVRLQGLVTQKARTVPLSTLRYLLKRPAFRETPYKAKVLALSLFVLRVLTDNSDCALSLNDFALFANRFYGRSYLHFISLLSKKVRLSL